LISCLIIFDEADKFMLHGTEKFAALINGCLCICLTATPDGDSKGLRRLVVDTLRFSRMNYVLGAPANQPARLEVDEVVDASSLESKAAHIVQQLSTGPVLVFCESDLAEQLV